VLFRQLGMLSREAWDEEGRLGCRLDGCSAPPIGQARLQVGVFIFKELVGTPIGRWPGVSSAD
jgi:hypothetical protein